MKDDLETGRAREGGRAEQHWGSQVGDGAAVCDVFGGKAPHCYDSEGMWEERRAEKHLGTDYRGPGESC